MTWEKLGAGNADDDILALVLQRAAVPAPPTTTPWTLQERVRVLDYVPKNKPFLVALEDVPAKADELLKAWPAIWATAHRHLVALAPCLDPRYPAGTYGGCYGCRSDAIEHFGQIYSSTTTALGFAEGIVSSLANWKLYALGIRHYSWTNEFLTAPVDTTFAHPLRPVEAVPAGALLHSAYCCAHALAWHEHVWASRGEQPGSAYRIQVFRDRIRVSLTELAKLDGVVTPAGAELLSGLTAWLNELVPGA